MPKARPRFYGVSRGSLLLPLQSPAHNRQMAAGGASEDLKHLRHQHLELSGLLIAKAAPAIASRLTLWGGPRDHTDVTKFFMWTVCGRSVDDECKAFHVERRSTSWTCGLTNSQQERGTDSI